MTSRYLKLFGLPPDATINDIKKAYRKIAKANHPDRFPDAAQKQRQEYVMARITEAYTALCAEWASKEKPTARIAPSPPAGDYRLYKTGVDFYHTYFDNFFQLFSRRKLKSVPEMVTCLRQARACLEQLVHEYPESQWLPDAGEKINLIDKALKNLEAGRQRR